MASQTGAIVSAKCAADEAHISDTSFPSSTHTVDLGGTSTGQGAPDNATSASLLPSAASHPKMPLQELGEGTRPKRERSASSQARGRSRIPDEDEGRRTSLRIKTPASVTRCRIAVDDASKSQSGNPEVYDMASTSRFPLPRSGPIALAPRAGSSAETAHADTVGMS